MRELEHRADEQGEHDGHPKQWDNIPLRSSEHLRVRGQGKDALVAEPVWIGLVGVLPRGTTDRRDSRSSLRAWVDVLVANRTLC